MSMKLIEALEILKKATAEQRGQLKVQLVCGFTPLHLQTFLNAHLHLQFPDQKIEIETGLYGDFVGNIERLEQADADSAAAVLEWADLDPRLGIRQLGGWGPKELADILEGVSSRLERLRAGITRTEAAGKPSLALSLPTLPLPPLAITAGWQASQFELELRERLAGFGAWAVKRENVRMVSAGRLDQLSPAPDRLDVKSELLSGFPYKLSHAAILGQLLANLIRNPSPQKGLITDLDDTLWSGLLGEVGIDGISWDLDHGAQIHGLYQQLLRALAEEGVLIAATSKNDPAVVDEAFRKAGLILPRERIFPMEVHWNRKSESVTRILQAWNIGADSVVMVDDSAMELADVKRAHPQIECFQFPKDNSEAAYALLWKLRDLFGKSAVREEDKIRLETIRRAAGSAAFKPGMEAESSDSFLEQAEAELTLSFRKDPPDPRALELVNKTNQFNLNGRRYTEAAWRDYLKSPDVFLLIAAYQDKYGPLGKISVIAGRKHPATLQVDVWVMSCRAFSRRIEHRCLEQLFKKFDVQEIAFDFAVTPKNGPFRDFLCSFQDGNSRGSVSFARDLFIPKCPPLFQGVKEIGHG